MDPRFRLLVHSRCHTHKRSYKKGLLWASLPESTHTKIDNSLTPTHTHTDFLFFSFFHLLLRPIFRLRSPAPKEKRIRASRFFFFLYCHFFFFFFERDTRDPEINLAGLSWKKPRTDATSEPVSLYFFVRIYYWIWTAQHSRVELFFLYPPSPNRGKLIALASNNSPLHTVIFFCFHEK